MYEYVGSDKWQEPLQNIAKVLGRNDRAQAVMETYRQQLETARKALAPVVKAHPKVLMVASEQLTQSVELVTSADFCGGLLEELGFQLVSSSSDEPQNITQNISIEVLPQLNADSIIVQGHNIGAFSQMGNVNNMETNQLKTVKQAWSTNTIAQSLRASRYAYQSYAFGSYQW